MSLWMRCFGLIAGLVIFVEGSIDVGNVEGMDLAGLRAAEAKVTERLSAVEKTLGEVTGRVEGLQKEKEEAVKKEDELRGARNWEEERKKEGEMALSQMDKELREKQDLMGKSSVHLAELKAEVELLQEKIADLTADKAIAHRKVNDPSLIDVLDESGTSLDPIMRTVIERTVHEVLPAVESVRERVVVYESRASRGVMQVVTLVTYVAIIGSVVLVRKITLRIRGVLTIPQMLLIGDVYCAAFWSWLWVGFLILRTDPLVIMQTLNSSFFFVFQICAFLLYVFYVFLRFLTLTRELTLTALAELLGVIVVGQHYNVRVWRPSIADEAHQASALAYLGYAWFFAVLAFGQLNAQTKGRVAKALGRIAEGVVNRQPKPREDDVGLNTPSADTDVEAPHDGKGREEEGNRGAN